MDIAEQIEKMRASRKAAYDKQQEVATKAAGESRSFSTEEQGQFDELQSEIEATDADIERLEKMLATEKRTAAPVDKGQPGTGFRQAKNTSDLSNGIGFAKAARALAVGALERRNAAEVAENLYDDERIVKATHAMMTKAAVSPATTGNANNAGNLVTESGVYGDFVEYLMARTIVGNLSMRSVPFRVPLISQDSIGRAYWTGENSPKGVTSGQFGQTSMEPLKIASIAVASTELLRDSSPAADALIRDSLVDALRKTVDQDFIDPTNAGSTNVKPASITNGVSAHTATGTDRNAVVADMKAVFQQFIGDNRDINNAVWVMDGTTALGLSLMLNAQGQPAFPGMNMSGGTLGGLPVVVSEYVPLDSANAHQIVLVDQANIYYANDGGVQVDMSDQASVEMSDSPDGTGQLVSLFQNNLTAWRVEQRLNWMPRRSKSVAIIDGVNYGSGATA